ncbi:MAG: hypothetical protein CM1200mP2_19340 [Planctomycetaceae bacterium]|nr:MAG: hypothetical protein CM1200mP2_19340 [Planctomycetaceae bacterium]
MRTRLSQKWNQFEQTLADATRRDFLTSSASGLGGGPLSAHLASELVAGEKGLRGPIPWLPGRHTAGPRPRHASSSTGPVPQVTWNFTAQTRSSSSSMAAIARFAAQRGIRFAFINKNAKLMASKRPYKQYGESGMWFTDRLPHVSRHADDIA